MTKNLSNQHQACWSEIITWSDYQIVYRPRHSNGMADVLTRKLGDLPEGGGRKVEKYGTHGSTVTEPTRTIPFVGSYPACTWPSIHNQPLGTSITGWCFDRQDTWDNTDKWEPSRNYSGGGCGTGGTNSLLSEVPHSGEWSVMITLTILPWWFHTCWTARNGQNVWLSGQTILLKGDEKTDRWECTELSWLPMITKLLALNIWSPSALNSTGDAIEDLSMHSVEGWLECKGFDAIWVVLDSWWYCDASFAAIQLWKLQSWQCCFYEWWYASMYSCWRLFWTENHNSLRSFGDRYVIARELTRQCECHFVPRLPTNGTNECGYGAEPDGFC